MPSIKNTPIPEPNPGRAITYTILTQFIKISFSILTMDLQPSGINLSLTCIYSIKIGAIGQI